VARVQPATRRGGSRGQILASASSGNGGWANGFTAIRNRRSGLSSPAVRLLLSVPQPLQRWMRTHSPSLRTVTAIGSIEARQSDARSPGSMSTWRLQRQDGQWFRWAVPGASVDTSSRQWLQRKLDGRFKGTGSPDERMRLTGWHHALRSRRKRKTVLRGRSQTGRTSVTSGRRSGGVMLTRRRSWVLASRPPSWLAGPAAGPRANRSRVSQRPCPRQSSFVHPGQRGPFPRLGRRPRIEARTLTRRDVVQRSGPWSRHPRD
jgi:hypothetical protein